MSFASECLHLTFAGDISKRMSNPLCIKSRDQGSFFN